ncbi:hypothetical protein D3C78_1301330 [compost metagenome]
MVDAIRQVELILGVENILRMDGIIPSISLFRDQMRERIVELGLTLTKDGCALQQNATLCALLCRLVDTRIITTLRLNHQCIAYSTLENELHNGILVCTENEAIYSLQASSHPLIEELSKILISWSVISEKYIGKVTSRQSELISESTHVHTTVVTSSVNARQSHSLLYISLLAVLPALLTSLWFFLKSI